MNYRVPAWVSRWARHTSPLAYQHGPFDQVGAPAYATFERLSVYGVTRRVKIVVRLRDLVDPEARRLCNYVERAAEFLAGAEILPPSVRGRGDLLVLG